jgi:uncharacterized HAD superfamily protein
MPTDATKRKLIIGVDMDDVIFDFNNSLHAYHNAKYGTAIRRQDITSYEIEKVWGCAPEEAMKKVLEFYETKEHDETVPVEGSIEGVKELSSGHELHIITSRADPVRDLTMKWLQRNFPQSFASVVLVNQFAGSPTKARSKADVCAELGVDLMIEDSIAHARSIAASGRPVILLDTPWNQAEAVPNVTRVKTWEDIVDQIRKISAHEDQI